MATFLTTRRMAPELAARIDASVRGGRRASRDPRYATSNLVAIARFAGLLAMVAVIGEVVVLRRHDQRDFEAARAALLDKVHAASAPLTPEDRGAVARVESWLMRSSGEYEGDLIADELRPKGALAAVLARPSLYIHGTLSQLSRPAGIAEAAISSLKDPFVVCLVEPPASRAESALLAKVRDAYSKDAEQHATQVRRFRDAQAGLPFLLPAWAEKVRSARTPGELDPLREEFEKAPIEGATRAVKAGLLLFSMDEPGEPGGAIELDGERAHLVRVGLVDLASAKVLLRMQKRVDPSWISVAKRPLYASGLDACALALDVREAVAPP